jgi:hypothetical protein
MYRLTKLDDSGNVIYCAGGAIEARSTSFRDLSEADALRFGNKLVAARGWNPYKDPIVLIPTEDNDEKYASLF